MPTRPGLCHVEVRLAYSNWQGALCRIDRLDQILRVRAQGRRNGRLVVEQTQGYCPECRASPRLTPPSIGVRARANLLSLLQQRRQCAAEHGAELVLFKVAQDRIEKSVGGVNGQIDRDETGKAKIVVPLVDVKEVRCLSLSPGIGVFASRRRLGLGSRWWILRRQEEALFGQQILVRGFQARHAGQVPNVRKIPLLSRNTRPALGGRLCARTSNAPGRPQDGSEYQSPGLGHFFFPSANIAISRAPGIPRPFHNVSSSR